MTIHWEKRRFGAKSPATAVVAFLLAWNAGGFVFAAESPLSLPSLAFPSASTATITQPIVSGPILPPVELLTDETPTTASSSVEPAKQDEKTLSLLKARFVRVLWERLRIPVFILVLGLIFLSLLLSSLRSRRPTRWRALTARSLILSAAIHLVLLMGFDSVVLSQRVMQTLREPEFEVLLSSDNLAEEKVSLGIREETTEMPLADSAVTVTPRKADAPLPETAPVEEKMTVNPGQVDLRAFEAPADVVKPRHGEEKQPPVPLGARAAADFRIIIPEVAFETPRLPTTPEPSETTSPLPTFALRKVEPPADVLIFPNPAVFGEGATTRALPVVPSAPPAAGMIALPTPPSVRTGASAGPTVPRSLLALKPPPKPLPAPIILEERPAEKEPYRLREPEQRAKVLEPLGGSPQTEDAVQRALKWLAAHQSDDGRWDVVNFDAKCGQCGGQGGFGKQNMAGTALATLAFLGAGHTHKNEGPYRENVARAVAWLAAQARPNGDLRGQGNMYDQGMATIALAEACGMTRDASLGPVIERACQFIASAQNRETGGWRYFPGEEGDTSVLGWQVMALKSASMAGVPIPEESLKLAERWLTRVGGGKSGGLFGYQDKKASPAMAAEGMFARQLLGRLPTDAAMIETADYLRQLLPDRSSPNVYYWYYGTLALFQHQGPAWEEWNGAMRKALLSSQEKEGTRNGSWAPRGPWGEQGGRLIETAMAAMCLEVYYRYLPLYAYSAKKAISSDSKTDGVSPKKPSAPAKPKPTPARSTKNRGGK